jgi:hypothetical protein
VLNTCTGMIERTASIGSPPTQVTGMKAALRAGYDILFPKSTRSASVLQVLKLEQLQ